MLNARHRFHGRHSLQPVYRNGRAVRGSLLSLKYNPRRSGKGYRVAVVVSKKVHKSAVIRNRIRRRVYEIIRQADNNSVAGKDLIFTVFSDRVTDIEASKLRGMVEDLLNKTAPPSSAGATTSVDHDIVKLEGDS